MMDEESWNWLHDATLIGVEAFWESGDVCLRLQTGSEGEVCIQATSCRRLHWSRELPWGPSVSVNAVRGPVRTTDSEVCRLEIELQSGDLIVIEARQFVLEADEA